MMRRQSNKGFSLVELAIGLAVITVLILAVSLSSGIRENARVQSASQSVNALRSAAESYLASGNMNYSAMTVASLKTNNLLPTSYTGTGANPWAGNYTIAANASSNTKVDIGLTGVPLLESGKLNAYFANSTSATSYDPTSKTWIATF